MKWYNTSVGKLFRIPALIFCVPLGIVCIVAFIVAMICAGALDAIWSMQQDIYKSLTGFDISDMKKVFKEGWKDIWSDWS